MKQGKSITDLAAELQDIKENSRDYIVPTERMRVAVESRPVPEANGDRLVPRLTFGSENGATRSYGLNSWSDRQLATYANIPQPYYDRIKGENPELFADSVNHGLARQVAGAARGKTEQRMIRTHRDRVRALVSDRYRRLDCFDLFEAVAPVLIANDFNPVSTELTEMRMYLQLTTERVQGEVKKGDVVQFGLVICSSDVGAGSVRVEPLVYRLVCTNGLITSNAIRKYHVGKTQGDGEIYELLTDETKSLSDAAFWAEVRDVVTASMRPEQFERQLDRLRIAAGEEIRNFDLPRVVELAARTVGITGEKTKQSIVAYLANGADGAGLTKWGLVNAVTHAAGSEDVGYDDSVDLERAGSKILDLTPKQWSTIAAAA